MHRSIRVESQHGNLGSACSLLSVLIIEELLFGWSSGHFHEVCKICDMRPTMSKGFYVSHVRLRRSARRQPDTVPSNCKPKTHGAGG